MTRRLLPSALLGAGALVALPASARAQVVGPTLAAGERLRASASATATTSPHERDVATAQLAPSLRGAVRVTSALALRLDVGLASTRYRTDAHRDSVLVTRLANPLLGAEALLLGRGATTASVGLTAGVPLATFPGGIARTQAAEHTYVVAAAARGYDAPWAWAVNVVPLVVDLRVAHVLGPVTVGADVSPAALVSVNREPSAFALSSAVAASVEVGGGIALGLRASAYVTTAEIARGDHAQTSLAPVMRLVRGGSTLEARYALNLDAPSGLAGAYGATRGGFTLTFERRFGRD